MNGFSSTGRQRVLFIGGLGRSGSTLVEKLLNELPTAIATGETVHLWERGLVADERCSCGSPFADCVRWKAIGDAAFGGWDRVDVDEAVAQRRSVDRTRRVPGILRALRSGRAGRNHRRYLALLRPVLQAAGELAAVEAGLEGRRGLVIESSKHLSTAGLLALDPGLDVRVLHLVRDPRGVAHSWTRTVRRPEAEGDLMPRYHPLRTATRWTTDNAGFELLGRRVPTLRLRYEDLLTSPIHHLHRVASFAGLPPDEIDLSFLDRSTAHLTRPLHSVAGNPLRFGGDEVTLRRDDEWRDGLARRHRLGTTALASPLLLRYGYDLIP